MRQTSKQQADHWGISDRLPYASLTHFPLVLAAAKGLSGYIIAPFRMMDNPITVDRITIWASFG
jgi:hypothetical protein